MESIKAEESSKLCFNIKYVSSKNTHDYIPLENNTKDDQTYVTRLLISFLIVAVFLLILLSKYVQSDKSNVHYIFHITDPHIDAFYDPTESAGAGACHSCALMKYVSFPLYNKSNLGKPLNKINCPSESEINNHLATLASRIFLNDSTGHGSRSHENYLFGRYGCDPPFRLWTSLLSAIYDLNPSPSVIILTGDVSPHKYPDDAISRDFLSLNSTSVYSLCLAKFYVTKRTFQALVDTFPLAKWAYSIGNNDHFPANVYWQPYIDIMGKMLLDNRVFEQQQYEQFIQFGSSFIDVEGVRYLSIDLTLFKANSEVVYPNQTSIVPKLIKWISMSLKDAKSRNLHVYIIGHQPLSTRFGLDEFDVYSPHYLVLKQLLKLHSTIIRVGLFGHNNLQNFIQVMSEDFKPLFPAIISTGVSPRGPNQPAFNVIAKSATTGTVYNIQQYSFNLLRENKIIRNFPYLKRMNYLGEWKPTTYANEETSWMFLSGEKDFTVSSLNNFFDKMRSKDDMFFEFEFIKRAGFIGSQTPENFECNALFDYQEKMAQCLFPNQNLLCWNEDYWLHK